MTNPYPIMKRLDLATVPTRGFMGLGRRVRAEGDLPKANGHQVHVYLTDGGLLVDHGQLRADDTRVVNARHVSVVDMGRDVPVSIQLKIPSAEASDFTVEVTFACTVTDASRVVRENLHAETALQHYLLNHRKIFQLGLPYKIMQISHVRIDVGAQISAYTTLRPPVISGLEVTMTSVQVHTPEELVKFEGTRRKNLMDHMVSTEEMDLSHRRDDLAVDYEHGRELANQRHAQEIQARAQRGRQALERDRADFARDELEASVDAIRDDAQRARLFAQARGELTAREVAEQMRAEEVARMQYTQQATEQARLDARRDSELDRAERRRLEQYERDQRLRLELQQREDKTGDRDYERLLASQTREDRIRREDADREDKRRDLEYKQALEQRTKEHQLQVLGQLRAAGLLDMANVDVERIIAEVIDVPIEQVRQPPVAWRNDPALPGESSAEADGQDRKPAEDFDAGIREEEG